MAAAARAEKPILIKKIKKGGGHGHHGGAWKVAYADFVTAMMAFFLLMWLINTTSPEQKRGIADFFAPASVSHTTSGSGSILAGTAMSEVGARNGFGNPIADSTSAETQADPNKPQPDGGPQSDASNPNADSLETAKALREDSEFDRAEMSIRQAMQDLPELAELSKNVIIEKTPEGLRIQIIDQEGRSMFAPGEPRLLPRAEQLLRAISPTLMNLPNRISIAGHTDGGSTMRANYTNWDLSADRANLARRVLVGAGVTQDRVYQVAGKADSEPLFPDDPTLPGNRRISITLLREAPTLPPNHSLIPH